jgi:hypothetical protein
MAGTGAQERNIMASQANTLANINKNASSGAQALALAGAAQGQTNEAFNQMGIQEAQNKYAMLQNLSAVNQGMTAENDKLYQDNLDYSQKQALLNASQMNQANGLNSLDNMIAAALPFVGGLMGGKFPVLPRTRQELRPPGQSQILGLSR